MKKFYGHTNLIMPHKIGQSCTLFSKVLVCQSFHDPECSVHACSPSAGLVTITANASGRGFRSMHSKDFEQGSHEVLRVLKNYGIVKSVYKTWKKY